ncbi:hypothetical protein NESM_000880600 [Novymonas esmeraldas]|uniref:Uncharacterized protein n=1 Tax=Novymonas esmeraldas TaxID=1808958 RepID=A0AAW0F200_9TRYP
MFSVDPTWESALADPLLLLRLYKRVAYGLVPRRQPDGPRALLPSFVSVDARYVESNVVAVDAASLLGVVQPVFPNSLLTRKEVSLLLHVLPLDEVELPLAGDDDQPSRGGRRGSHGGGIRPGDVMRALRDMIPFRTMLVAQSVAAVRRAVHESPVMRPFEEHVVDVLDWRASRRRQAAEPAPPPLERWEALVFMEETCQLSSSETHGLLRYCACCDDDDDAGADDGEDHCRAEAAEGTSAPLGCDVQLLHQLLFSDVLPGVAEYPLLMGRFAEASLELGESDAGHTGTLALLSSLATLELVYPPHSRRVAPDLDAGTLVRAELSPRHFFYVCARLRTSFCQEESDQLYYYLKKDATDSTDADNDASGGGGSGGGVLVADLLHAFRQYFPSVSLSMLRLVQAAVVVWVRRGASDAPPFVTLYAALREWGAARVPIRAFIAAMRSAGVPDGIGGVLDVELEWLRLRAPTRVDLLLMLCSPVPPARAAVTRKLFDRLDDRQCGAVACATVLSRFHPEHVEGPAVRRHAVQWKAALAAYVEELEESELDYDVFAYFWYMISAGVEDDPTYTMAVWQAFGLADSGARPRRA